MTQELPQTTASLRGPWAVSWLAATLLSMLLAYQNLPVIQQAGLALNLWDLFLRELVVWYSWVLFLPLIWWLAMRFPVSGAWRWRNLAIHAFAAPLVVLAVVLLFSMLRLSMFGGELMPRAPYAEAIFIVYRRLFAFFLFVYAAIVAALRGWQQAVARREGQLAQARLETLLHESRLENLRAQLDPHFLFNALNAISSLVGHDAVRARQMIARLSGLLRMSLGQDGKGLIPLGRELELLGVYLEIQQLRFGDRLNVRLDLDDRVEQALVPHLVLQPLVENAVHHGIEQRADAGNIEISVGIGDDRLRITVTDDGPGFPVEPDEHIGLGNLRGRLQLHFGDAAELRWENLPEGGARVIVLLPFEPSAREG